MPISSMVSRTDAVTRSLPEQDAGRSWEEWRPFTMAHVVQPLDQPSNYKDSQSRVDRLKQVDLLAKSSTLYVRIFTGYVMELAKFILPDW